MAKRVIKVGVALFSFLFILQIAVWFISAWAIGSVGLSAIKTFADDCSQTYTIESYLPISGNLFCPKEMR